MRLMNIVLSCIFSTLYTKTNFNLQVYRSLTTSVITIGFKMDNFHSYLDGDIQGSGLDPQNDCENKSEGGNNYLSVDSL